MATQEIIDLFTELLFGSGAFFGLIIIIGLVLLISVQVKFSSPIFIVLLLFLAWEYFNHISDTTLNAWYFLIVLMTCALLGYIFYRDMEKR